MITLATILSAIVAVFGIWPRRDGGGIPYAIILVAPEVLLVAWAAIWGITLPLWYFFG